MVSKPTPFNFVINNCNGVISLHKNGPLLKNSTILIRLKNHMLRNMKWENVQLWESGYILMKSWIETDQLGQIIHIGNIGAGGT